MQRRGESFDEVPGGGRVILCRQSRRRRVRIEHDCKVFVVHFDRKVEFRPIVDSSKVVKN